MRITTAHLENLTDWINSEKGYPLTAYERDADGILHAQQLHIIIRRYSGRCHVEQIVNAGGGVRDLNHGTARECYEFLRGMQEAIMLDQRAERYAA